MSVCLRPAWSTKSSRTARATQRTPVLEKTVFYLDTGIHPTNFYHIIEKNNLVLKKKKKRTPYLMEGHGYSSKS